METGNFEYTALPEDDGLVLRLLKLIPGPKTAPLICKLVFETFQMPEIPQEHDAKPNPQTKPNCVAYEPLSYTWGDPNPTSFIKLNNCPFGVTKNLEAALRHLRDLHVERTLWVDAICIDQGNNREKEILIPHMASIYCNASKVAVWLGEGSSMSDRGMNFAAQINQCFKETARNTVGGFGPQSIEDESFLGLMRRETTIANVKHLCEPSFADQWMALYHLLRRPWWERAWVLQEIVLAKSATVYCGDQSQPWAIIGNAARVACITRSIVSSMLAKQGVGKSGLFCNSRNVEGLVVTRLQWMQLHYRPQKIPFEYYEITAGTIQGPKQFITANIGRKSLYPQDKIFSVLGLLPRDVARSIKPDYDNPSHKVLKEAVQAFIKVTGSLNIICSSQYSPWQEEMFPSWIPNWERPFRMPVYADQNHAGLGYFDILGSRSAEVKFSEDLSFLTAKGCIVGEISDILYEWAYLPGLKKIRGNLDTDETEVLLEEVHPNGLQVERKVLRSGLEEPWQPWTWDFEDDYWKIVGPYAKQLPSDEIDALEIFLLCLRTRWAVMKSRIPAPDQTTFLTETEKAQRAQDYVITQALLIGRTLAYLVQGNIGFVPDFTKSGDLVCLLIGCNAPVILRKQIGGTFIFIGDCRVSEFMHGEGITGLETGKYTLESFCIGPPSNSSSKI
ncbi:heterokaryon incompatibility protein-domain-containing protein [Tricladium varicosporioides]|nr:heterokaryon incompatibility protein-domain-containing protein [Hymenoscyphus varicosporioides]